MTECFGTCYKHHSRGPDRSITTNHPTYDQPCKGDLAQDSRRILSYITVCNYNTTHLQENPQRLG